MDFNLFEILFEILINVTCLGLILFVLMLITVDERTCSKKKN